MSIAHAIFAAGCFWGVQAAFDAVPGVISTEVGYTGGNLESPNYRQVSAGNTGHAEAVQVTYDTDKVSYEKLLDVFFASHNPTTRNRQGPDVGEQYRSAIFYLDEAQKNTAEAKIAELNKLGKFKNPIVTQVVPAGQFYAAEDYHQKYLQKRGQTTCHINAAEEEEEEEIQLESINKDNAEWKKELTAEQFKVLREKGTEMPFSGKYLNNKEDGTYNCGACGNPIFASNNKFDSGSGWPSFDEAIPNSIKLTPDNSHGMNRVEVTCAKCSSHLGHLFNDGPTATGERFCINSVSLGFEAEK